MCLLTLIKDLICHSMHAMFLCHIRNHVHAYTHILWFPFKKLEKNPIYGSPLSFTPSLYHKISHGDNLITI